MQFHEPSAGEPVAQHRDSPTAGKVGEKRSAPCCQAGALHLCTKEATPHHEQRCNSIAATCVRRECNAGAARQPAARRLVAARAMQAVAVRVWRIGKRDHELAT